MTQGTDEAAIRGLVDAFTQGWNAKSGEACARPFAADADFINIMGLKAHGRDQIARGHDEIFGTVFRDMQISSRVDSIRFIRPDVAVVDVAFTVQAATGAPFQLQRSLPGLVAAKARWILVDRRLPQHGPVRKAGSRAEWKRLWRTGPGRKGNRPPAGTEKHTSAEQGGDHDGRRAGPRPNRSQA